MDEKETALIGRLLQWYDREGRAFPFRGTKDPYRIWVSEIMLQQTQTATVAGYYLRFIQRFPDVRSLAEADGQEVLKLWEGLGYYSRARSLHRAAGMVAGELGGVMPKTAEALEQLPGIGSYTAAAIASIAYDEPVPAMDGNLTRVISRLYDVQEDVSIPSVRRRLYALGCALMPDRRAGDANQALMDLGATLCLPGTPDCPRCPLLPHCAAGRAGEPERLPLLPKARPPRVVPVTVLLLTCRGRILVVQRREALLRGLYVYLLFEGDDGMAQAAAALQGGAGKLRELEQARHVFTHRVWEMRICHREAEAMMPSPQGSWVTLAELDQLPLPTAMRSASAWARRLLGKEEIK
ncbi:MAG: A/G-specific adenine glycosylase [Christensenellales bacterium]